ncbi:DUF3320 domain-containing protein [Candidatus Harpocratesius sp.]
MVQPPGFRPLEKRSDENCKNCANFSQAYDGFCIKYGIKITQEYMVCELFLPRGSTFCPFCSAQIEENLTICPHCQSDLISEISEQSNIKGEGSEDQDSIRIHQFKVEKVDYTPKFEKRFRIWKQYLLDLSKRNFQLNFRPHSKRTIEIISPSLSSLFQLLVGEEKRLHFQPVFHPDSVIKRKLQSQSISEKKKDKRREKEEYREEDKKKEDERNQKIKLLYEQALFKILESPPPNKMVANVDDKVLEKRLSRFVAKNQNFLEEKGVNALYFTFGLFKWQEKNSNEFNYSPILFVPIKISRVSVKTLYTVQILDENLIINPSLMQKMKIDFNFQFPSYEGEYSKEQILKYFELLSQKIESHPAWEITFRTFISFFAFNKIPLFQDLYDFKPLFFKHPFILSLAELSHYSQKIDTSKLSEERTKNEEAINAFSILDIDYSQLQAVSYIEQGYSCVIRGPPGTGKSQCIANIIAECLSDNEKVLFVAQKSAALEVVKERLDKTGIGEFCLELHSDKSNKRQVMDQISHTYNTELKPFVVPNEKYHSLSRLKQHLNSYVSEINKPFGPTECLIEQKLAALDQLREIKEFSGRIPNIDAFDENDLDEIEDILSTIEDFSDIRANYDSFSWRLCSFSQPPEYTYLEIQEALLNFQIALTIFQEKLELFYHRYGFKSINSPSDLEKLTEFFSFYSLISLNIDINEIEQEYISNFNNTKRFFSITFYQYRKKFISKILIRKNRFELIKNHIQRIKLVQNSFLDKNIYQTSHNLANNNPQLFYTHFDELNNYLQSLLKIQNSPILAKLPITNINIIESDNYWNQLTKWCSFWQKELKSYSKWVEFSKSIKQLKSKQLDFLIKELMISEISPNFASKFRKTYLIQWLERVIQSNPSLYRFRIEKYSKNIQNFKEIDANLLRINRYRLAKRLFENRPIAPWLYQDDEITEIGFLNRELIKRRNIKPLRDILDYSRDYLLTLKPCLLMSPLSVATYLPLERFYQYFDLVIFDEASQICTEDAIGAIIRGKQVVVVGDEKQLPPTRFFTSQLFDESEFTDPDLSSYESVLEEAMVIGLPVFTLKNHYRSKRENLIVFSNYNYYSHMLNTFPDIFRDISTSAINFHYIKEGKYDRGKSRTNKVEAEAVANAILEHYQNNKVQKRSLSLGVIAFNEAQMDAIQKALAKKLKANLEKEKLVDYIGPERLFIKNIENVQGNERDVIFFSIGYGYDYNEEFRLNFGALNQMGGERRLNVAITRARYRMEIFCSFNPNEIDFKRTQSKGLRDFFQFLQFVYSQTIKNANNNTGVISNSGTLLQASLTLKTDLQRSIANKIKDQGFNVDIGVGKSKNQIDIAIVHPFDSSRYILGIILDHGSYAFAPNATERFRIRPYVLKSLDWNLYHIYSIEWFQNYKKILKEISEIIYKLCTLEKERVKSQTSSISSTKALYQYKQNSSSNQTNISETKEITESSTFFVFNKQDLELLTSQRRNSAIFRKKLLSISGVEEYKIVCFDENFSIDDFHDPAYERLIEEYIREIVTKEGPIHFDLLVSRMSTLFGYKKKSNYVKQKISDLIFSRDIVDYKSEPGFLLPKDHKTQLSFKCRIALHPKDDPRKFNMISLYEISNCILFVLKDGGKMPLESLQRVVMNFFGKRSTSHATLDHFLKAIRQLKKNHLIRVQMKIASLIKME